MFRPAADASGNHIEAQFCIGRMHKFGIGVVKDLLLAGFYLNLASLGGHSGACFTLARLYEEGGLILLGPKTEQGRSPNEVS